MFYVVIETCYLVFLAANCPNNEMWLSVQKTMGDLEISFYNQQQGQERLLDLMDP